MNSASRQDGAPLGVVVVSLIGGKALRNCLSRVAEMQLPCIVMLGAGDDKAELQSDYPEATLIDWSGQPVPVRRKQGVELIDTPIVALIEDSSLPEPGWQDAIMACFTDIDTAAAGGPVCLDSALGSAYLALGCGEYGRFHPRRFPSLAYSEPREAGILPVTRLPGNNLAYRRDHLMAIIRDSQQGLIEGSVNEQLLAAGRTIVMNPAMSVRYAHKDRHGASLNTRFQHGRLFASNRVEDTPAVARLSWALKSAALPFLLTARGVSSMRYAVNPSRWLPVTAWIFMMETGWALGECTGYLFGRGKSLEAWS